jgi:phage recombination protein Bet
MNTVALHNPQGQQLSVIAAMASDYNMDAVLFEETLRAAIVPRNCTREEFTVYLLAAKQYKLNPLLREIYAIPKKGGGIQPVVSIDGWYHICNDHPQFDGIEYEDRFDADTFLGVTARIWRKDRSRPTVVTEWLAECKMNTDNWQKWPRRMTRHKAGIQCARIAFGFSGIVDPDEAERFTQPEYEERRPSRITDATVHSLRTIDAQPGDFTRQDASPQTPVEPATIDAAQYAHLQGLADEVGVDHATICERLGVSSLAEIPASRFEKLIRKLELTRQTEQSPSAAAPPPVAETPAMPPADNPPVSVPPADTGGDIDPIAEAHEAGRAACEAGIAFEDIPAKFRDHAYWRKAYRDGYQAQAQEMGA